MIKINDNHQAINAVFGGMSCICISFDVDFNFYYLNSEIAVSTENECSEHCCHSLNKTYSMRMNYYLFEGKSVNECFNFPLTFRGKRLKNFLLRAQKTQIPFL